MSTVQYPPAGPIFRRKALKIGINPEAAFCLQSAALGLEHQILDRLAALKVHIA